MTTIIKESTHIGDADHSRDEDQCQQLKKWDRSKRDLDKKEEIRMEKQPLLPTLKKTLTCFKMNSKSTLLGKWTALVAEQSASTVNCHLCQFSVSPLVTSSLIQIGTFTIRFSMQDAPQVWGRKPTGKLLLLIPCAKKPNWCRNRESIFLGKSITGKMNHVYCFI